MERSAGPKHEEKTVARIPYPTEEAVSPPTRAFLGRLPALRLFSMLAHADVGADRFLRATFGLWRDGRLSPYRRELVILMTARLCKADYEWKQHVPIALAAGVGEAKIRAIKDIALLDPSLNDDDRAILAMTRQIVETPRCNNEVFAAANRVLTAREMVEVHLICGMYLTLARLATNLEIEIDQPVIGLDGARSA